MQSRASTWDQVTRTMDENRRKSDSYKDGTASPVWFARGPEVVVFPRKEDFQHLFFLTRSKENKGRRVYHIDLPKVNMPRILFITWNAFLSVIIKSTRDQRGTSYRGGMEASPDPHKKFKTNARKKTSTQMMGCSFFVCRKNLFSRFSSSFASLGLVCSLSTAFMTFYRFNSYRSDVAWMCVPGNTFTSRKFPDLYLLMPLSNFFSTTLDDTTCCFISARWYENQSMGNRDPYLILNLYPVIEWAWKYAGATKIQSILFWIGCMKAFAYN